MVCVCEEIALQGTAIQWMGCWSCAKKHAYFGSWSWHLVFMRSHGIALQGLTFRYLLLIFRLEAIAIIHLFYTFFFPFQWL